jgi:hypothetical protein
MQPEFHIPKAWTDVSFLSLNVHLLFCQNTKISAVPGSFRNGGRKIFVKGKFYPGKIFIPAFSSLKYMEIFLSPCQRSEQGGSKF